MKEQKPLSAHSSDLALENGLRCEICLRPNFLTGVSQAQIENNSTLVSPSASRLASLFITECKKIPSPGLTEKQLCASQSLLGRLPYGFLEINGRCRAALLSSYLICPTG